MHSIRIPAGSDKTERSIIQQAGDCASSNVNPKDANDKQQEQAGLQDRIGQHHDLFATLQSRICATQLQKPAPYTSFMISSPDFKQAALPRALKLRAEAALAASAEIMSNLVARLEALVHVRTGAHIQGYEACMAALAL